jgi:flagellar biosynthesis protein FlhF
MKIKTYIARDMRQALRMVREEQGPDAVILSTRQVDEGIEICAALDADTSVPVVLQTPQPAAQSAEFSRLLAQATIVASGAPPAGPVATPDTRLADAMGSELRSMRHLLELQLSQLAWNDLTRRAPALAELLKEMTEMGIAAPLSAELVAELPDGVGLEDAQRRILAHLSKRLTVTGDALLEHGGRVAFVGPTGVGKTTGIAKLAARWVMRHGTRDIALISIDDQRFGAHEQLRVLGRLLGVECFALESAAELPQILARLPQRRLVLIDTAGASPRESGLDERATALCAIAKECSFEIWLTLSAGAQAGVLEEAAQRFASFKPRCVVLTKLDEAASLGGALSALIASGLPLSYVSEGPRIPEDLAPARAHQLVSRAVALARISGATAGEDLLARRFGGVAHGIR